MTRDIMTAAEVRAASERTAKRTTGLSMYAADVCRLVTTCEALATAASKYREADGDISVHCAGMALDALLATWRGDA